eukprot:8662161-Pyramimonas_sp.AAC.1
MRCLLRPHPAAAVVPRAGGLHRPLAKGVARQIRAPCDANSGGRRKQRLRVPTRLRRWSGT